MGLDYYGIGINNKNVLQRAKYSCLDNALFGVRNKMIVVVSWADLARSELLMTYKGAVDFILRYIVTGTDYVCVTEFAKILEDGAMNHQYDNAFRLEIYKPNLYPTFLQTERHAY